MADRLMHERADRIMVELDPVPNIVLSDGRTVLFAGDSSYPTNIRLFARETLTPIGLAAMIARLRMLADLMEGAVLDDNQD